MQPENVSDILNNIPVGVCVLFMPDDTHQEVRFANKQQMRLISPHASAPEKISPDSSALRAGYYKNAFNGVHPDDLQMALKAFREGFHLKQFSVPRIRLKIDDGSYVWVHMDVTLRETLPEGRIFYASYRDISKEVELEEELEAQRQKNVEKTLLNTIGRLPACSVLYIDQNNGTFIPKQYSDEYLSLMGFTCQEKSADNEDIFFQSIHPDDKDDVLKSLDEVHEDKAFHNKIFRVQIRNGSYKWVSVKFTRFSLLKEHYLYVVITDIDDLKKQEQMLQKQYDAAQSFFDSVAESYLMSQRSNLTQNKVELLRGRGSPPRKWEGRKYDELVDRILQELPDEEDRKNCLDLLDRTTLLSAYDKGVHTITREFKSRPAGQETLWVQGVTTISKRPESGDVISFLGISNIGEKKLAESIVHKIVEEQCDYICCINVKTHKVELFFSNKRWNGKETIAAGSDFDENIKNVFLKYILPEEQKKYKEFTNVTHVLESLEKNESETALFHSKEDGALRIKMLEFSYLDKENNLIALVKTDITDMQKQQLEQENRLREALDLAEKANAEKSVFLSTMSHDLRTPLNGVLGFTTFALKESDVQKKQEYLEKIESSGNLLLELVNDTLDLSRIESGKTVPEPEAVMSDELIPAVVTALRPSAELKGVKLIEDYKDYENQTVWADKLKINKIILNLLSNSIKFTPKGGSVTVTPFCALEFSSDGGCGFIVEDTGIGMSEEFMKHMYEPFAQEKRSESVQTPGTGLGLSIVKRYVDLLGGTISVESHLHTGTRWQVILPVKKLQNGIQNKGEEKTDGLHGKRILLCEDNGMNVEIASMLLKEKNVLVEAAENGAAGVEKFISSPQGYYDAVLMDIRMPEMDGYEATKIIRASKHPDAATVPIIAMTADAFEESIRAAKEAGMDAYITKPIEPQKMFRTLQNYIGKQRK